MILFDEIQEGDLVCHKSVRLDGHYVGGIPYEEDGLTLYKKGFTLVETTNGFDLYVEGRLKPVDKFEVKNIKEAVDFVKKHYDLAQLLEQLKAEGYAVTWHKILPNTILGGTHTELTKDCTAYINSFTVTQEEEGFTVRILGQITEDQKVSTGEEVLRLLGTSLQREQPAS